MGNYAMSETAVQFENTDGTRGLIKFTVQEDDHHTTINVEDANGGIELVINREELVELISVAVRALAALNGPA